MREVLDRGRESGEFLEQGIRRLFSMFADGLTCSELNVQPLGGALFGDNTTPLLSSLKWGERAVAGMLDRLLWTSPPGKSRERVHYGPLDVEDLGRVYEALLELEPGIATEPVCRLRRSKLEVVVPLAQGEKYRPAQTTSEAALEADEEPEGEMPEEEEGGRSKKTQVLWVEEILPGRFYLRVGLGRKATGSFYTPHSFVRFLVEETLGPKIAAVSPKDDPKPLEILKIKVLDPAMGSGHFLVEACRYLGEALYETCRLCDERLRAAQAQAQAATGDKARHKALAEVDEYRRRIIADDEILRYLPTHAPEQEQSGLSVRRALALCRAQSLHTNTSAPSSPTPLCA